MYWRPPVIARERSDEAIQTKLLKAFVWIGSQGECEAFVRLPLAMMGGADAIIPL